MPIEALNGAVIIVSYNQSCDHHKRYGARNAETEQEEGNEMCIEYAVCHIPLRYKQFYVFLILRRYPRKL